MSYKPIDSKRDQFRKYVESSGVVEMFSKVLIELFKREKHENPIDFIRENLGATLKEKVEIDFLKEEVNSYRHQVEELKKQLEDLQFQHQKQLANQQQANDAQKLSTSTSSSSLPSQPIVNSDKDDSSALSGNDVKSKETLIVEDTIKAASVAAATSNLDVDPEQTSSQNEEDLKIEKSVINETTVVATKTTTITPPTSSVNTSPKVEASTPILQQQQQQQPATTPTPINAPITTTESSVSDETPEKPTAT